MTTSAESPNDTEPLQPYVENMDPSDDPVVEGHGPGDRPPFPPVWEGDPYTGHSRSCGVRVKSPCTCGMWELEQPGPPETPSVGPVAEMKLAFEYLHGVLHLPPDVHIVDCYTEANSTPDLGNIVLLLEAFSDDEFPSTQVTARFHSVYNSFRPREDVVFDGWEDVS
jgi:hypothetical protein